MSFVNKRGIALVALVMMLVFVSLMVSGVTIFIVQRLLEFNIKEGSTRAIYLAQAGINQAIYNFRFHDLAANGYFSLGQTNIDADQYFVIGATAGDLLMLNTSAADLSSNGRQLLNLTIQNAANSKTITINRMIITWNNSQRLRRIEINGRAVWTGARRSPANVNVNPNFTLNTTPSIYPIDQIGFSGNMRNATITVQFVMSDGSTTQARVAYPASDNYNFTVKATGRVSGHNLYRTMQAEYNALTSRIVQYSEINTPMSP